MQRSALWTRCKNITTCRREVDFYNAVDDLKRSHDFLAQEVLELRDMELALDTLRQQLAQLNEASSNPKSAGTTASPPLCRDGPDHDLDDDARAIQGWAKSLKPPPFP